MTDIGTDVDSTYAGYARCGKSAHFIASMCLLNGGYGTGTSFIMEKSRPFENYFFSESISTTSGMTRVQPFGECSKLIFEFRRISGLTWEKISEVFDVTRRSVHFWANGKPMEEHRAEKLYLLLDAMRKIDTGMAVQNRSILFEKDCDGISLFDLFRRGDFFSANLRIGSAVAHARQHFAPVSMQAHLNVAGAISPIDLLNADSSRIIDEKKRKTLSVAVRKLRKRD